MNENGLDKMSISELKSILENSTSRFKVENILSQLKEKYIEIDYNQARVNEINIEIVICRLWTGDTVKNRFPQINNESIKVLFTEDILNYLKNQSKRSKNLYRKSRYSDIVFEVDKSNFEFAKIAVNSYLDWSNIQLRQKDSIGFVDSLGRSLSLALFLKENNLIVKVLNLFKEKIEQLFKASNFLILNRIVRILLKYNYKIKNKTTDFNLEYWLEESVAEIKSPSQKNYNLKRSILKTLLLIPAIKNDNLKRRQIIKKIGKEFENEGDFVKKVRSEMVAGTFYDKAIKKYHEAGESKEFIDKLKIKTRETNVKAVSREFSKFSFETSISIEHVQNCINQYKEKSLIEIIDFFGNDQMDYPSFMEIKNGVVKSIHPILIFSQFALKDGIKIKEINTIEEKIHYDTVLIHKNRILLMNRAIQKEIFKLMEALHNEYPLKICEDICTSELIDENRSKILNKAFEMYSVGNYIGSMHLLVFQIEGILRQIIKYAGEETFIYKNGEAKDLPLGSITRIIASKELMSIDLIKYIEVTLNDILGLNIRNEIAHGRLTYDSYNQENNQLLIAILIKITRH